MKFVSGLFGQHFSVSIFFLFTAAAFTNCRKVETNPTFKTENFNIAVAKEWYYATFKKSAEWQQSPVKGKQLPVWELGTYRKVGKMEIVEFPLRSETTSFAIFSSGLTAEERRTVFAGSLSRVVFIKTSGGRIIVRALDYIPDLTYLQQKKFDISEIMLGTDNNDFTGRLIIKEWGGKKLSIIKMKKGEIVAQGKINPFQQNEKELNTETVCTVVITCDEMQSCTYYLEGDRWIANGICSGTTYGNCYTETYGCDEDDDIPGDDDQCNFGSSESCECQLFQTGCDEGGGGESPFNNDDNDGIAEIKIITENIDDPCLKKTYGATASAGLSNNITNLLHNTFGASVDFNISFIDDALNNYMKDANTASSIYPSGRMDFTITLNTEVLPDASKEYTTITIYHEVLHTYLSTAGIAPGQGLHHPAMANGYVIALTNSLLSAYPNLDAGDARALAWGGLQDTPAFDSIRINHPVEHTDLISRNSQHRVSTRGTPCN